MNRIKVAALALAAAAGLLAAPSAANAGVTRAAESVYTVSSMTRCFVSGHGSSYSECVSFKAYTTYSATQIWINGHVSCGWSSSGYVTSGGYYLVRSWRRERHGLPERRS